MDVAGVLTAVAGLVAGLISALQISVARRSQEHVKETLRAAREPTVDQALMQGNLTVLGGYFFDTLGQLPLAKYAEDAEARKIVADAVRNVESFVDPERYSAPEKAEVLLQADAQRLEAEVAAGDYWGGLSRLRRRIELSLREAAAKAELPAERLAAGQLLKRLVSVDIIPRDAAAALREALQICNRGVHGEAVTGEEVERALALAAEGLGAIGMS